DYLSLHTNLTPETRDMISAKNFPKMKPGVLILNCARGEIVNTATSAAGRQSGIVGGYGPDVLDQEPPPADHPLLKLPNVVITPHLGASTVEAQARVAYEGAQLLVDFLTRGVVQFAVNMAAVDRTELEELRLYVDMARRLGLLH